jgi:hypothetical protein
LVTGWNNLDVHATPPSHRGPELQSCSSGAQSNGKGTIVIHHRKLPHPATDTAGSSAADLVATFLVAWENAAISYERLLATGLAQSDHELSRDQNYARLLKAGQHLHWIGGHQATAHAARLIARQIPEGSVEHFDRLWCGLMPQGSG